LPTNLDGSVLRNAKLAGSFLAGASLAGADLSQADFSEDGSGPVVFAADREINGQLVSLRADLAGANLSGANFRAADLSSANLEAADLSQANLRFAILRQANLNRVNLSLADMRSAIMQDATLQQANLSGVNLTGANLTRADLSDVIFENTDFVSNVPVDFPGDMTYRDFLASLSNQDCVDGTFLLREDGTLAPTSLSVTDNLGRRFYNSGAWRNAVSYLCAADFSEATLRNLEPIRLYWAGVDLSQADLRFMNLREAVLEDVIQVDGMEYPLEADLTEVTYDLEFTTWPPNFVPPPNTPREEEQPGEVCHDHHDHGRQPEGRRRKDYHGGELGAWACAGRQAVLLVDLDPQGQCATILGLKQEPGAFNLLVRISQPIRWSTPPTGRICSSSWATGKLPRRRRCSKYSGLRSRSRNPG
jgi:uncharacterized protein YjbI with pentapeptide repeats